VSGATKAAFLRYAREDADAACERLARKV